MLVTLRSQRVTLLPLQLLLLTDTATANITPVSTITATDVSALASTSVTGNCHKFNS